MTDAAFWIAVVLLTALCAGEPDLLDAINKLVVAQSLTCPCPCAIE